MQRGQADRKTRPIQRRAGEDHMMAMEKHVVKELCMIELFERIHAMQNAKANILRGGFRVMRLQ